MPEADASKVEKSFYTDVPQKSEVFFLKGSNSYDWGMKNRLAHIFDAKSGKTVMLAFDHGYFQGPTTGLERPDITILPLAPYADALMLTRGILRSVIPPSLNKAAVLRASGGPSILKELSNEHIAMDMDDAVRVNACAVATQVFVGIPVLGVTAVGSEMVRDAKYIRLATRMCAELGAAFVKTYFVPDFETVTAGCPVPIVIAGGKKMPELEALKMACEAINQGAAGVDMGRNIFQSEAPVAMIRAVRKVVHENMKPKQAYEMFLDLKKQKA